MVNDGQGRGGYGKHYLLGLIVYNNNMMINNDETCIVGNLAMHYQLFKSIKHNLLFVWVIRVPM